MDAQAEGRVLCANVVAWVLPVQPLQAYSAGSRSVPRVPESPTCNMQPLPWLGQGQEDEKAADAVAGYSQRAKPDTAHETKNGKADKRKKNTKEWVAGQKKRGTRARS